MFLIDSDRALSDLISSSQLLCLGATITDSDRNLARVKRNFKVMQALRKHEYPLHYACQKGRVNKVTRLLREGRDVNEKDEEGRTPLHEASILHEASKKYTSALDVIDMLVRHGAELESRNKYGRTPLDAACRSGHVEAVKKVVAVWILYFLDVLDQHFLALSDLHELSYLPSCYAWVSRSLILPGLTLVSKRTGL